MEIGFAKKLTIWIKQYGASFIIAALLLGNIYQYIQAKNDRAEYVKHIKELENVINASNNESLKFERARQDKQDELLRELLRKTPTK